VSNARAADICVVSSAGTLNLLPNGCDLVNAAGSFEFDGATASNGDLHTVVVQSLDISGLVWHSTGSYSATFAVSGVNTDTTTSSSGNFSYSATGSIFTLTPTFSLADFTFTAGHNVDPFRVTMRADFGAFAISTDPTDNNAGFINSTDNGDGTASVATNLDMFYRIKMSGASSYTGASDNGCGGFPQNCGSTPSGTPVHFVQADNSGSAPEPATFALVGSGLAGVYLRRRRAR